MALKLLLSTAVVNAVVNPDKKKCESATIEPLAQVIVLDVSGSIKKSGMYQDEINAAKHYHDGLVNAYNALGDATLASRKLQFGVVTFSTYAKKQLAMTKDASLFHATMSRLAREPPSGYTHVSRAISQCVDMLKGVGEVDGVMPRKKCVIFMDGAPQDCRIAQQQGLFSNAIHGIGLGLQGLAVFMPQCKSGPKQHNITLQTIYANNHQEPGVKALNVLATLSGCASYQKKTRPGVVEYVGMNGATECSNMRAFTASRSGGEAFKVLMPVLDKAMGDQVKDCDLPPPPTPCFATDTVYYGDDLKNMEDIKSPEECQSECVKYPGAECKTFTFKHLTGLCYLKKGTGDIRAIRSSTSGPRVCDGTPTEETTTTTTTTTTEAPSTGFECTCDNGKALMSESSKGTAVDSKGKKTSWAKSTAVLCSSEQPKKCSSCDKNFVLDRSSQLCVPDGFECTCDNGKALMSESSKGTGFDSKGKKTSWAKSTAVLCTSEQPKKCSSCDKNFVLDRSSQQCVPEEPELECKCNKGYPREDIRCTASQTHMCASCKKGYRFIKETHSCKISKCKAFVKRVQKSGEL